MRKGRRNLNVKFGTKRKTTIVIGHLKEHSWGSLICGLNQVTKANCWWRKRKGLRTVWKAWKSWKPSLKNGVKRWRPWWRTIKRKDLSIRRTTEQQKRNASWKGTCLWRGQQFIWKIMKVSIRWKKGHSWNSGKSEWI